MEVIYGMYTGDDNDLGKIHLKFIKSTLGFRKQTPTLVKYGDTGRFPLIIVLPHKSFFFNLCKDSTP